MSTKHLVFAISICLSFTRSFSQDSAYVKSNGSMVPFYKWEVGIDLLSLTDKQKDDFGYVVKRNYQLKHGRSAIRFRLLPRIENSPVAQGVMNSIRLNLAIGYERQHLLGRFAYLYGVEPTLYYFVSKTESDLNGLLTRYREYHLGADGFFGGRFYLTNHLSLTLETHLLIRHNDVQIIDNVGLVAQMGSTTNQLLLNPIHILFLSYHF